MVETERVTAIFEEARVLYSDALEELGRDKLRNAAEKAWAPLNGPPTPSSWPARGVSHKPRGIPVERCMLWCSKTRRWKSWLGVIIPGPITCMGSAFTMGCVSRLRKWSGASAKPPVTSVMPKTWHPPTKSLSNNLPLLFDKLTTSGGIPLTLSLSKGRDSHVPELLDRL